MGKSSTALDFAEHLPGTLPFLHVSSFSPVQDTIHLDVTVFDLVVSKFLDVNGLGQFSFLKSRLKITDTTISML
jgi:hypothetical protein